MEVSQELLALFSSEAEEILGRMEQSLVQLESQPGDQELLDTIFRGAHTLKGNSAALGFDGAAEFCHDWRRCSTACARARRRRRLP